MGTNLHKDLTDAQLHVPKGFSTASNSTVLTKDSGGNLVWATDGSSVISNKRLSVTFSGAVSAKSSANYGKMYAREQSGFDWSSTGGLHWTGTITPEMVMSCAFYVVPVDCTVEKVVTKASSGSSSMQVNMSLWKYTYDCSLTPTTITESLIVHPFEDQAVTINTILCSEKTTFTTSSLSAGDMLVVTYGVDLVTNQTFRGQGTILLKID